VVDSLRARVAQYFRAPFWSYRPVRPAVRRLLILLAAVLLILDSLLRATSGAEVPILQAVIPTAITLCIPLYAWRPPAATVALIAVGTVAAVAGVARDSLIPAALIVGFVAMTCSLALTSLYGLALATWIVVGVFSPGTQLAMLSAIVIIVIGVVSGSIGFAIRQQNERAVMLATRLEATEQEVAEQLRHERDLIADELHDIVAHEITIVALHAAVLEHTEDSTTRTQSQTAIREAAVQALTDIRRVLGMVRGEESLSPERVPSRDGIPGTVADVTRELTRAGISVTTDIPDQVRLPSTSLVALTRVMRESSTNVLKHATGATNVHIALTVQRGWAHLEFRDDSPPARTAGLPASGYGIMRLRERFRVFGGSFSAERRPEGWVVSASLPLES